MAISMESKLKDESGELADKQPANVVHGSFLCDSVGLVQIPVHDLCSASKPAGSGHWINFGLSNL